MLARYLITIKAVQCDMNYPLEGGGAAVAQLGETLIRLEGATDQLPAIPAARRNRAGALPPFVD